MALEANDRGTTTIYLDRLSELHRQIKEGLVEYSSLKLFKEIELLKREHEVMKKLSHKEPNSRQLQWERRLKDECQFKQLLYLDQSGCVIDDALLNGPLRSTELYPNLQLGDFLLQVDNRLGRGDLVKIKIFTELLSRYVRAETSFERLQAGYEDMLLGVIDEHAKLVTLGEAGHLAGLIPLSDFTREELLGAVGNATQRSLKIISSVMEPREEFDLLMESVEAREASTNSYEQLFVAWNEERYKQLTNEDWLRFVRAIPLMTKRNFLPESLQEMVENLYIKLGRQDYEISHVPGDNTLVFIEGNGVNARGINVPSDSYNRVIAPCDRIFLTNQFTTQIRNKGIVDVHIVSRDNISIEVAKANIPYQAYDEVQLLARMIKARPETLSLHLIQMEGGNPRLLASVKRNAKARLKLLKEYADVLIKDYEPSEADWKSMEILIDQMVVDHPVEKDRPLPAAEELPF